MLEFTASPARVREATKLAYRYGIQMNQGVSDYWRSLPRAATIPGFAFTLKPYQAEGVAHLEKWDGNALIGDEPGLGKTATVMAYAHKHRRFPMLAVLPKTLILNWRRELTLMLGTQLSVLVVGFVPSKQRQAQLKAQYPHVTFSKMPLPGFDVTLINYDIVARNQQCLEDVGYDYVVVDESHKVKSISAQRTKAIIRLVTGREEVKGKRNEWRVLHAGVRSVTFMTGTPILAKPVELWTTVNTLASWVPQFNTFFKFASQYCNAHKTQFGWDFNGASNEAELHRLLTDTIMIRRRKDQVLQELPAKMYTTLPLMFDRAAYDKVAQAFEHTIDWKAGMEALVRHGGNVPKSDEAIVAIQKLREIAAYSKIDSAVEWISDFVEGGQKLVVFAHHRNMILKIKAGVEAHPDFEGKVVTIMGGVSLDERNAAVESFQNDAATKLIIISHSAGGYGITLTAASTVAFVELPWGPADMQQCEDRVHRIGQTAGVNVIVLAAEGTIEESIADMIMSKAQIVNNVVDGGQVPNSVTIGI
jgi:SWI/SNF-related matrix-associated actin-dependent regulator 1 of chromatin subfamily A